MINPDEFFNLGQFVFKLCRVHIDNDYFFQCQELTDINLSLEEQMKKVVRSLYGFENGVPEWAEVIKKQHPDIEFLRVGINWDSPDFETLEMINKFIDYSNDMLLVNKIKLLK